MSISRIRFLGPGAGKGLECCLLAVSKASNARMGHGAVDRDAEELAREESGGGRLGPAARPPAAEDHHSIGMLMEILNEGTSSRN